MGTRVTRTRNSVAAMCIPTRSVQLVVDIRVKPVTVLAARFVTVAWQFMNILAQGQRESVLDSYAVRLQKIFLKILERKLSLLV